MAIGIIAGRDDGEDKPDSTYEAAGTFVRKFQKRFGCLDCRTLTGYDLSNPVDRRLMSLKKVKEKRCCGYMEWALDELSALLAARRTE